ncbi:DUF4239 domain-containing protein [Pedobacter sp. HMF7647]|uniref:DUF4239 domain-containing protein n=2 Tax=Hufsiella arboris TaxID=2695275 RepID=A0A7K1Y6V7_9SPHI|nr:DUF4239 domain-containing protein [Hufsiella arboris]
MLQGLINLPATILCMVFIVVVVVLSQAGLQLYQSVLGKREFRQGNEVAGIVFGGISLLYSLVLAFVIVAVWENYESLNNTIEDEADKLNGILAHSAALPPHIKKPLDTAILNYCNRVVEQEWKMQSGRRSLTPSAIPSLRMMLLQAHPQDDTQQSVFSVIDQDLSSVSELRRTRLSHSRSQVPQLVWFVLKAGSLMLIVFSYFFCVPSLRVKRIYLFFLSSCIAMSMFLVYALDHPFAGSARVSNEPYREVMSEIEQENQ